MHFKDPHMGDCGVARFICDAKIKGGPLLVSQCSISLGPIMGKMSSAGPKQRPVSRVSVAY